MSRKRPAVTSPDAAADPFLAGPPTLLVDADLHLLRFNPAAAETFPLKPADAGRPLATLELGVAMREIEVLLRDVISRGTHLDHELQDGNGHWFLISGHPLRTADGVAGAMLLLLRIDRLKRTEQASRESDRRKDEFIATLAHELRSPLAALRDAGELIEEAGTRIGDAEQARAVMQRQVANMVRMVDDLAELSRMQHGHLRLRPEVVDVVSVLHSAAATTERDRRALSQTLHLQLPAGPVEIIADAVRAEQIFTNLLVNASKATLRRGELTLSVDPIDTIGDGPAELKVRLRQNQTDSPQSVPRVLDVLSSAPAPSTSRASMSLSLYLARQLAEMHGGALEVHGAGSEFVVRLPVEPGRVARPEPAPANARRVLVVDDNVDAARIMAMVLGVAGHEVRLAHRGLDTLEAARKFQPDAVLLDIGLPDIDGFEVARRLRAEPSLSKILLIAVTGYGRDQDIRMSREAGFDEHFIKPVNPDALNSLIARKPGRATA